jgi:hypothetical protein
MLDGLPPSEGYSAKAQISLCALYVVSLCNPLTLQDLESVGSTAALSAVATALSSALAALSAGLLSLELLILLAICLLADLLLAVLLAIVSSPNAPNGELIAVVLCATLSNLGQKASANSPNLFDGFLKAYHIL